MVLLVENVPMNMENISIRVDAEAARTFRSLPKEDRTKLEALLGIRLNEMTQRVESLDDVLREVSERAKTKGLTADILKSLLDED